MKKLFLLLYVVCVAAFAEASFDQIESLIEKQQYSAAASGLEGIIANHPNSAKAYYAMAQAQAGMGNQEKARFALNKARGIDPELKFAPASSVQSLEVAITPQVKKIEAVHETSYAWLKWLLALGVLGLAIWYYNSEKAKKEELEAKLAEKEREAELERARAARAAARAETPKAAAPEAPKWTDVQKPAPATAPTPPTPPAAPAPSTVYVQPAPTVVHHHTSSNDGLVTGMVLGQMMSNNHHHDTTRVIEREVIREVPAPSRDSSWDTPTPSRSSSWDSDSSSSSSWGSSSSSSSSSSWDSGSSSSDSSSSWD